MNAHYLPDPEKVPAKGRAAPSAAHADEGSAGRGGVRASRLAWPVAALVILVASAALWFAVAAVAGWALR